MKCTYLLRMMLTCLLIFTITHSWSQYQMEKLDRGVVAMSLGGSNVFVSWRWLGNEDDITFNLYRNGTKINASPLTVCNFTDNAGSTNASYTVRAIVNGVEQTASAAATPWAQKYMKIPLSVPPSGTTPKGEAYTYSPNDCSIGDVDGDGQYEIFVKWDPSNSKDNSQSGYTGNVYIDCYTMAGTLLWRIDLGKNIRAGAHYTQFLVYDFDGDGMAEMACKTADGTKDGKGVTIGNASADYRNSSGYILTGPEFLTVFNGKTGAAMATTNYLPARGTVSGWGDSYGNRVDRFIAAVAYVDGQRPSMIFGRGYYTRLVRVAWDWRNGQLTQRWTFDSNTSGNSTYAGQGNHQMTVGDMDGDGKQEVCNGSSTIDDNGKGLYSNRLGHGDAMHMSDMDPDRPGLEVWQCHEDPGSYGNYGLEFRDAKTGQPLWGLGGGNQGDVGRAMAADIDPRYKGYECWGTAGVLYDCKGKQIGTSRPSVNFGVYWDGDLQRELLDGNKLDKWNYTAGNSSRIASLYTDEYGTGTSCNSTKATPNLSADLFGDWREEIILHSADNKNLLIYTTPIASTYKFRTLLHDPQYRVAIAWQNSAYNQPPHLGYYLGTDMATPAKPNIKIVGATNQAPVVSITAPANNATFTAPATITITANASDADGTISNIQFYNGATLLGSDATSPYSFSWTNVVAGTYSITVKATDNSGAVTTSSVLSLKVNAANINPVVSITTPASNATFTAPASISITASASDSDGTISNVQFYNGATLIGSDATFPYSVAWTNVAEGTYSITAKAFDNSGAEAVSAAIIVVVTGTAVDQSVLQGETACNVVGILNENTNAGFNGTGYVNTANQVGSSVDYSIVSNSAKAVSLALRYANSGTTTRAMSIAVNGTVQAANVEFPSTGAWTVWATVSVPLTLAAGNNTVQLVSLTADGGPNLDELVFNTAGITMGTCTVNPPANVAPTVTISSPATNASFTAPATVAITATANDSDGTISNVQFYNGTILIGSDATFPYTISWTNVAAGTYSIIAKATDDDGAVTTSAAVSIKVTEVLTPAGDIIGANCGTKNTSATFELSAANKVNATAYSWWYTGSSQSLTPVNSDPSKVVINYGSGFTGGDLCIGVNYSVSPWYKQYCKTLTSCGTRAGDFSSEASEVSPLTVAPNPSSGAFTITVSEAVNTFTIVNDLGAILYTGNAMEAGASISLGEQFAAGLYTVFIHYANGKTDARKLQKIK